jgi:hypothetical protein
LPGKCGAARIGPGVRREPRSVRFGDSGNRDPPNGAQGVHGLLGRLVIVEDEGGGAAISQHFANGGQFAGNVQPGLAQLEDDQQETRQQESQAAGHQTIGDQLAADWPGSHGSEKPLSWNHSRRSAHFCFPEME